MPTVVNRLQPITLTGMKDVTFGDWIRKQRSDRGWSQSRVARELSRIDAEYKGDPSYISKLERGDVGTPLLESRERFHKIFHTSEQDLIDLGIVKQYDQWGREITHRAPATIALAQEVRPVYDDDDAPLTPDEEAIFINLVFRGYAEMTNAQKRMIINATKQALNEGS